MIELKERRPEGHHEKRDNLSREIARFETMSTDEIDKILASHGVDGAEVVATVEELVRTKLSKQQQSGGAAKKNR
jgi:hypothetical protein